MPSGARAADCAGSREVVDGGVVEEVAGVGEDMAASVPRGAATGCRATLEVRPAPCVSPCPHPPQRAGTGAALPAQRARQGRARGVAAGQGRIVEPLSARDALRGGIQAQAAQPGLGRRTREFQPARMEALRAQVAQGRHAGRGPGLVQGGLHGLLQPLQRQRPAGQHAGRPAQQGFQVGGHLHPLRDGRAPHAGQRGQAGCTAGPASDGTGQAVARLGRHGEAAQPVHARLRRRIDHAEAGPGRGQVAVPRTGGYQDAAGGVHERRTAIHLEFHAPLQPDQHLRMVVRMRGVLPAVVAQGAGQ